MRRARSRTRRLKCLFAVIGPSAARHSTPGEEHVQADDKRSGDWIPFASTGRPCRGGPKEVGRRTDACAQDDPVPGGLSNGVRAGRNLRYGSPSGRDHRAGAGIPWDFP
ncbi:hypothetical protein GCM10017566_18330 [Amycolatopsis bartoniae]|uniref:Uncharacterized protein n=1 Tax=Amycolatopsis bartoniae TaxID=941986 RepID=A0A8H9IS68_9PSEU|nr:hypothetical protein GCM10017566_18330 [Amycolatopsis bartoniae]